MSKIDNNQINEAIDLMLESGVDLKTVLDKDGLIKQFTKRVLEKAMSAEMEEHLGYDKYSRKSQEVSNYRNGKYNKTISTDNGVITLDVPRDRESSYEPQIVPKKKSRIHGFDSKILSMYAKGLSCNDIKEQVKDLYDVDISESLVSKITDKVNDDVTVWQTRPLERVYPIVYFDCIVVKVRHDNRIINKSVYIVLGIDISGHKEVLGLWMSENEGAKFWLGVFTELQNRGLKDILIACTDNLTGMHEAISSIYPKSMHQLCIVHQLRNSLKYVSYKDRKEVANDLKPIYKAVNEKEAETALDSFDKKWSKKYPQIAKSWYNNWENLVVFLDFPEQIRRVIYTTNAIESVNSQLRKTTKNKKVFPNDTAVYKILYLTIANITRKWSMPISNWNEAMSHFLIKFEGRI